MVGGVYADHGTLEEMYQVMSMPQMYCLKDAHGHEYIISVKSNKNMFCAKLSEIYRVVLPFNKQNCGK